MKKALGFVLMLALAGSMLFAGGGKEKAQEIYFLNFKPEIADVYEAKVIFRYKITDCQEQRFSRFSSESS